MPNLSVPFRHSPLALALALGVAGMPAQAVNPVTEITTGDLAPGTLGLGFGWRFGDSPYRGIDDISSKETEQDSDLLPFYYYDIPALTGVDFYWTSWFSQHSTESKFTLQKI